MKHRFMRTRAKGQRHSQPSEISYDKKQHGWIVNGNSDHVFPSKEAAIRHCLRVFASHPKVNGQHHHHQELPQHSVWTGAPWDHYFEKYQ